MKADLNIPSAIHHRGLDHSRTRLEHKAIASETFAAACQCFRPIEQRPLVASTREFSPRSGYSLRDGIEQLRLQSRQHSSALELRPRGWRSLDSRHWRSATDLHAWARRQRPPVRQREWMTRRFPKRSFREKNTEARWTPLISITSRRWNTQDGSGWRGRRTKIKHQNQTMQIKLGCYTNYLSIFAADDVETQTRSTFMNNNRSRFSAIKHKFSFISRDKRRRSSYLVISSWLTARGVPGGTAARTLVDAWRDEFLSEIVSDISVMNSLESR